MRVVMATGALSGALAVLRTEPEAPIDSQHVQATMDNLLATAETAYAAAQKAEKRVSDIALAIVQASETSVDFKTKAATLLEQVKTDAAEASRAANEATALVKQAQSTKDLASQEAIEKVVAEATSMMNAEAQETWGKATSEWNQLQVEAKNAGEEATHYYDGVKEETDNAIAQLLSHADVLNNQAAEYVLEAEKERRSALWAHWYGLPDLYRQREGDAQAYDQEARDARAQAQGYHKQAEGLQKNIAQISYSRDEAQKYAEFIANPLPRPDFQSAQETLPHGLELEKIAAEEAQSQEEA